MGRRRTATISCSRWGWTRVRLEFGPWWWRWWLILRHGGRPHYIYTGEPCVRFNASPAPSAEGGNDG